MYRAQGQYAVALVYYQQALAIHQEVGNRSGEGTTLSNIASVYRDRGQYADALDYFEQALAIFQEIGDRSGEGTALNNTGGVYDLQGQYAEALDHYQQALAISRGIGDLSGEWAALASIGSAYDLQGQVEEAVEYYTQGVAVVETIHADIRAESGQTAFFAERVWPYDRLVALLAAADPTQAFLFAERGRARTFLYQLGNERLRFGEGADAALLEEWQTQTGEIEALHARHVEVSSQPLPSSEALHDLSVQIEALEAERADLEARITRQNLALAQFTRVNLPEVAAIQAAIPGDTTMLTYYVAPALSSLDYEGEVFAFVVTQEDLQVVALPVTPNELTTAIAAFRLDESAQGEQLRSLYDWLIAPLTGQLTTSHLVLAPHDVLNYLPFAALSSESGHVLADDFTIAYTPSATVYTVLQQTRPTPQREVALVLGNPAAGLRDLPHAAAEATIVADLLGTTALLEETATESAFRAGLGTATVIHLAAHGVFDVRQPLSSYVALAPDADHDGRLEVREVYALPLGAAPLVVLSACQTAVGELTAGDEFQGLTRAFLLNGARGVVASLWSVDDAATTALMVAFHENRLAGMSDAEALAAAQRAVREHEAHPEWALPYYWAAFVLVGPGEVR